MSFKTLEEARCEFLARIDFSALKGEEKIRVDQSVGRVTSKPVYARISVPHFAASAMDGFAVKLKSAMDERLFTLGRDAFEVNTGDPLPAGTSAVVPLEMAAVEGQNVIVKGRIKLWQHVRLPGEDVVRGDVILPSHHIITPLDIGVLIASGVRNVWVFKKPRILVVPTGNELIDLLNEQYRSVEKGKLIDYMSYVAVEYLRQKRTEAVRSPVVTDKDELLNTVRQGVKDFHLVLIIGGTSVGSKDFTRAIIEELGIVIVAGIRSRPGKPTILGIVAGKPVIGVPGYPNSAFIAIKEFAVPVIDKICPVVSHGSVKVQMGVSLVTSSGFDEFVRVKITSKSDRYVAFPTRMGLSVISPLAAADGVVRIPHDSTGIEEGAEESCELLRNIEAINRQLLVIGEQDPILQILDNFLRQVDSPRKRFSLCCLNYGSLRGLLALRKGLCEIAAVGQFEEMFLKVDGLDEKNAKEDLFFVNIVRREIGLMVKKDNPKKITSVTDIAREGLTFLNLPIGYSPRTWLDKMLKRMGVNEKDIRGYDCEVNDIATMALQIEQGTIDVGLGTYPMAKRFGLEFLPVAEETFDFCIKGDFMSSQAFAAISDVLCSTEFKRKARNLGYSARESGQLRKIRIGEGMSGNC